MNTLQRTMTCDHTLPLPVPSNTIHDTPLTRVSLAFVEHRINMYLRFGHPVDELRLDRWRRCASFQPDALFCRVRWESNDYGTTRWQLMVLRTCSPTDVMQRIAGIRPGARLLLCAEGKSQVRSVLLSIDAMETLGIDPAASAPAYWRTLGNRLHAHLPPPVYTVERHAAYLAGEALQ